MRGFIKKEIEKTIKKLFNKEVDLNVSADGRFGDYSSNIAMLLGVGNPRETAEKIKSELEKSSEFTKLISGIEIAPPSGTSSPAFLNFALSEKGLIEGLKNCHCPKQGLGQKKRIQVEFISANPTGELHIGHGRSAFYGDALANVLEIGRAHV